jgi:hypothetical protein
MSELQLNETDEVDKNCLFNYKRIQIYFDVFIFLIKGASKKFDSRIIATFLHPGLGNRYGRRNQYQIWVIRKIFHLIGINSFERI